jgi:hypothetical protein
MLEIFLQKELCPHLLDSFWFKQYGATAHTAQISMAVLRMIFPGRFISHFGDINWPTHSPDLVIPDYFLWGYVESNVYEMSCQY